MMIAAAAAAIQGSSNSSSVGLLMIRTTIGVNKQPHNTFSALGRRTTYEVLLTVCLACAILAYCLLQS